MSVLALHTTAIRKQDVGTQLEDLGAFAEMATLEMVLTASVGPHNVNYVIHNNCIVICYFHFIIKISTSALALHTTAIRKQDVGTQLEDLGAFAEMATLEMVLTASVGPHNVNYVIHNNCIVICYFHFIIKISTSALALHTTAIRKQDVRTQLEDLGALAEMATLEMAFSAMVGPHNVNYMYRDYERVITVYTADSNRLCIVHLSE